MSSLEADVVSYRSISGDRSYPAVGTTTYINFRISKSNVDLATGTPTTPARVSTSRSADNSTATLSWELFDPVSEYEIEREQAITIEAMTTATTQYGNTTRFTVAGTIAGVDEYEDATVEPGFTYRYRVRAKGGDSGGPDDDGWSAFSAWAVSGGQSSSDTKAPGGFQAIRADDNSEVVLSWTAPDGEFDGFAVQRQELVLAEGSTIFANPRILADGLAADATSYTDTSIAPGRTYEYRVASLEGGVFGQASEWARVSPFLREFGQAPPNFGLTGSDVTRAGRREYWLAWDDVQGADEYELEIGKFTAASGHRELLTGVIVTDPMYFYTAFMSAEFRVRGRMKDDTICGDGDGALQSMEVCISPWTSWVNVNFVPPPAAVPDLVTPMPADPATIELRDDLEGIIDEGLGPLGGNHNATLLLNALTLVGIFIVASSAFILGHRRGMAPAGFAAGIGISIVLLALGQRLLHIPTEWLIVFGAIILVGGGAATIRSYAASKG